MRILVAPDKFKDSLGAAEVAEAIAQGLRDVLPNAEVTLQPIADGGEGTARVICEAAGGEWHSCQVHDPLGRIVTARYCTIANGQTAVIEMSEASGLWRVAEEERDPVRASSFGCGEMLLDALRRGVREIVLGLGGSATNDGGFGMARALGFRFLDARGAEARSVIDLEEIIWPNELPLPRIIAAADVRNPLLGEHGATRVFAAQKGASVQQIDLLERALGRFAEIVGHTFADRPGAGAAGGLGFGLTSLCAAELRSGFEVVAERIGLRDAIRAHDVVVTGEGRLDAQTLEGKAPAGLAEMARTDGRRLFAIVGATTHDPAAHSLFERVFVVGDRARAAELLRERGRQLGELLRE